MATRSFKNVIVICLAVSSIAVTGQLAVLPWWGFILPIMFLGAITTFAGWEVTTLGVGFTGGFFAWFAGNIGFHLIWGGHILFRLGTLPGMGILVLSGIVGGLITAFALYSGKCLALSVKPAQKG